MAQPRVLARGLLLVFVLVTLLAAPLVFTFTLTDAAKPQQSDAAASPVSLVAATGSTPEYAGAAKLARLQAAAAQQAATNIVISEFRSRGPSSNNYDSDEFIELFNPTGAPFTMTGWSLWRSDCLGGASRIENALDPTVTLDDGGHYLIGGLNYSGTVPSDKPSIDIGLADNGGLALRSGLTDFDPIVDRVGMCEDGGYFEITALSPLFGTADQSYDRNVESDGICTDAQDNFTDFFLRSPSDPQNKSSPVTACGNPTATPIATATRTATPTRTPLGFNPRVIINEVGWAGTAADPEAQWIELYNPTDQNVILDDWTLETPTGSLLVELQGSLPSGGYYLLVHGSSAAATATPTTCIVFNADDVQYDQIFTGTLSQTGQIVYLINPSNSIEDSADRSGGRWPAGTLNPPKSMERSAVIPDTTSGAWFTFEGSTDSTPRDCNGTRVRGTPGSANWAITVTRTPSPTPPPTRKPTAVPPTPFAHMVINEFLPRAGTDWNEDGAVNVYDEFIELKNLGPIDVDLQDWKLDDVAGQGSPMYTLPSLKLKPGERAVFYGLTTGILLEDSGDTVRLINPQGIVIDARGYDVVEHVDESHCRIPDGYYWRLACFATPGNENALTGEAPAPVPIVLGARPPCLLADTVPEPFREAECDAFGDDMWDRAYWEDTGLAEFPMGNSQTKWKTIVE